MSYFRLLPALLIALATAALWAAAADEFRLTDEEQAVLKATNAQREKNKLPALKANPQLAAAAHEHSEQMAKMQVLGHTIDNKSLSDRVKEIGYKYLSIGENVAANQPTPEAVVDSWMKSPGHRANILNKHYTEIGVGIARDKNGAPYYTQVFGRPMSAGAAVQASFTVTNKANEPARVDLPGSGPASLLSPGDSGKFTVSGMGKLPDARVQVGGTVKDLSYKDGGSYVIEQTEQGVDVKSDASAEIAR
jgi:hypothetical protein